MERKEINFVYGGIKSCLIENPEKIQSYIDYCVCIVCLKILRNPVECEICDSNFCFDCLESLKILKLKPYFINPRMGHNL